MKVIILNDHTLFAQGLCKTIYDSLEYADIVHFKTLNNPENSLTIKDNVEFIISDIELK